jgi:1-deoxy-D-xylulose-5-phosphate reductoisomerase
LSTTRAEGGRPINIAVLGSTGSIGRQTIEVAEANPDKVRIVGISAHRNTELLEQQQARLRPKYAIATARLSEAIASDQLIELVTDGDIDLVVVATVGAAGLKPTLAALKATKRVALANKEALVMAGPLYQDAMAKDAALVPIDSEHSAVWQCLRGEDPGSVEKVVLTASGGAFRDLRIEDLDSVSPSQALHHPTWVMGPKITVDSATLMNKGLEILEATILFGLPLEKVGVIMHRESIVHSLVFLNDSSVKAQLGVPDMRLPIQLALSHPNRWPGEWPRLDLTEAHDLHFEPPNWDRYPCMGLAVEAGRQGGTYPAALCAADEVAVDAFLTGAIRFTDIHRVVGSALDFHLSADVSYESVLAADREARARSRKIVKELMS